MDAKAESYLLVEVPYVLLIFYFCHVCFDFLVNKKPGCLVGGRAGKFIRKKDLSNVRSRNRNEYSAYTPVLFYAFYFYFEIFILGIVEYFAMDRFYIT